MPINFRALIIMTSNVVTLKVDNGQIQYEITGWTRLSITRGIERIPNSFDLHMSEKCQI
jgi:prophage tail gpP-like protein